MALAGDGRWCQLAPFRVMSGVLISAAAQGSLSLMVNFYRPTFLLLSPSPGCGTSHGVVQVHDTSRILEEVRWTLMLWLWLGEGWAETEDR